MQLPNGKESFRSEINVTPLVDVCLVLLIIFMVVTPLLRRELPILLPETKGSGTPPPGRQLTVSMLEDQTVLIERTPVPLSLLTDELRRLRAADPDRPVLVQGDRRLRYEQLSKLLESLDDAGFQKIGLIMIRGSQAQRPD
jgi:biopolymer transport protein ExbD